MCVWGGCSHQQTDSDRLCARVFTVHAQAKGAEPTLMSPQTHPANTHAHTHTHTFTYTHTEVGADLRVFGDPVPQHVENSVRCSSPNDEILVTRSFGIRKN